MKTLEQIVPLTFYREKLLLPHNSEDKKKGMITYTLNCSNESIIELLDNRHPFLLNSNSMYISYYYDFNTLPRCIVSELVRTPAIQMNDARQNRFTQYDVIKAGAERSVKTFQTLEAAHGLNVMYDLQPTVELLSKEPKIQKIISAKKLKVFFDTIQRAIDKSTSTATKTNYNKSILLVNLDDFAKYNSKEGMDKYHIAINILLLMRKPQNIMEKFKYNFKILFYTKSGYFIFDMNTSLRRNNLQRFNMMLKKLKYDIDYEKIVTTIDREDVANVLSSRMNFTGDPNLEDVVSPDDEIVDKVLGNVESVDEIEDEDSDKSMDLSEEILEDADDETLKMVYLNNIEKTKMGAKAKKNSKRDELLREQQKKIKIGEHTLEELTEQSIPAPIEHHVVKSKAAPTTNEAIKDVAFANFEKTYLETDYKKHLAKVITSINDKPIDMNVLSVKVDDTSDILNLKETYTVVFEDSLRNRHTLKVNLPKFIDNRYMLINGGIKHLQKQFFMNPIVKIGPDTVQICTNYKKVFIYRVGKKFNPNFTKFAKLLDDPSNGITCKVGNNTDANREYLTCLEYDEFAKQYSMIKIGNATFDFNMHRLMTTTGETDQSLDKLVVGYTGSSNKPTPIYYDKSSNKGDLVTLMLSYGKPELTEKFKQLSAGKKYVYNEAVIMKKRIPVIVLLCFFEGLTKVIHKFGDGVEYTDKKVNNDGNMYIKFSDGYIKYSISNTEACILFNGLNEIDTNLYTISEMDDKEVYLDIFETLVGSAYITGALNNFYDWLIDPITLDILNSLNLPTDIVSVFIYASNLLADNQYRNDIDLHNQRLRDFEIVPAILYQQLSMAYSRYKQTANNPNPVKISVDEDCVLKEIVALTTVEPHSRLSPMIDANKEHFASLQGLSGMNQERAYKPEKRAYHDSMLGVVGLTTATDRSCGKIRQLALEPKILNTAGSFDVCDSKEDVEKLSNVNLSTPMELFTPLGLTHDDPTRTAMASKQSSHTIPVNNNCPILISTGMEQMVHYRTGNDFSVVAQEDGVVTDINEKTELMVVTYKSGKTQAVDLSKRIVKNGAGGFYITNQLTTDLKVGSKFKRDDILGYDKSFYKEQGIFGNRMTMGSLQKVACISNFATFEDSAFVTHKMSRDMATDMVMEKTVSIGKNSTVDYIVKKGQPIALGEDLIRFDTSYDDESLNELLANVRDDLQEDILNLGKTSVTAKYTGVVEDIAVYSTVPLNELSPSLRKIVSEYQNYNKSRQKYLDKYDPNPDNKVYRMGVLFDKPTDVVKPDSYGKIRGEDAEDNVIIEFYIKYHDELSDGDKLASFTANKNTIGYMIPEGYEPFTEFRPYEEISTSLAPSAILQRGTPSVVTTACVYKVLIELKRKIYEILTGEDFNDYMKRKNPYMVYEPKKKPATESLSEQDMYMLESVFDLYKDTNDKFRSMATYDVNDVVFSMESMNEDILNMFNVSSNPDECNLKMGDIDNNIIYATKMIDSAEKLVLYRNI